MVHRCPSACFFTATCPCSCPRGFIQGSACFFRSARPAETAGCTTANVVLRPGAPLGLGYMPGHLGLLWVRTHQGVLNNDAQRCRPCLGPGTPRLLNSQRAPVAPIPSQDTLDGVYKCACVCMSACLAQAKGIHTPRHILLHDRLPCPMLCNGL